MAEYKFEVGDKVIVDYSDDAVRGYICTILARHRIAPLPSNYYELKEVNGLYVEHVLLPYVKSEPNEKLVSSIDLSQLFKEGL